MRSLATVQRHDLRRPNRLSPHMPATSGGGSQPPNRHRAAQHGARVRAARGRDDGVGSVSRRRSIPMWENRFRNKIWHFMRTSASIATDAPACPPPPDSGFRRLSSHHPTHKRRGWCSAQRGDTLRTRSATINDRDLRDEGTRPRLGCQGFREPSLWARAFYG